MELKDPRELMVDTFIQEVDNGLELLVAVSDSTSTSKIKPFSDAYPDRIINVGIAEQNMLGISAGLALGGYTVATANAAPFLVSRSAEQVKNDVAYTNTNVKMMGLNPGFAYGSLGPTHHSIEDISMMRSLGTVRIYTPVDPLGTADAVHHVLNTEGPAYVRVDSGMFPVIVEAGTPRPLEAPWRLSEGGDVTILGLGTAAHDVKKAVAILKGWGIVSDAWAVPSIRPLKLDEIITSAKKTGFVVTVEAHSTHGGLGSLVSECLTDNGTGARLKRLGLPEGSFAPASPRSDIEKSLGIDSAGIAETVRRMIGR